MNFNEAEVAFLFTAPISRRTLIHYKLISGQVGLLLTSLFLSLLSGRFRQADIFLIPLFAYWLLFATVSLHMLAASFTRTMLLDRGLSPKRWRILAGLGAIALLTAIVFSAKDAIDAFDPDRVVGLTSLTSELSNVFSAGIIPYLLFPFRLLLQPLFQRELVPFLSAALPVVLIFGLHYAWVLRMNVAFEEASVEQSKKIAEKVSAMKKGEWKVTAAKPRRAWFRLHPVGPPWMAIFWKNLISAGNAFQGRTLVLICIFASIILITSVRIAGREGASIIGFFAVMILIWSAFLGPALVRNDFRQDFPNTELFKTLPLRPWQIAFGQLLSPTVMLTLVQWLALLIATIFLQVKPWNKLPFLLRAEIVGGTALLLPLLTLITLTIPNLAVLLLPAWFQQGRDSTAQGIEAMGQRIIMMFGQVVSLTILMIPIGIAAGLAGALGFYIGGPTLGVFFGILATAIIMTAEAALMIWLMGKAFTKLDLSEEASS